MKIIFLDIDGVLNHELWYKYEQEQRKGVPIDNKSDYDISQFCTWSVGLLNGLTNDTGAKIVLSSSWRKGKSLDDIKTLFEKVGITGEVIGLTPCLYFTGLEGYGYSVPRGCEIKAWLETNKDILDDKMSKVKYVILDDDSDMLYWQRDKFLWVDPYAGITRNTVYKAKMILQ
jgi:hypothetical protein